MKLICLTAAVLTTLFAITACDSGKVSKDRPDGKLSVFVSIPPQAGFVRAIGGEHVVVSSLADEGQDPHQVSVPAKRLSALLKSHAYFTVGMPFEKNLLEKISAHKNTPELVDTTQGVKRLEFGSHEGHDHSHGDDHHGHSHEPGEADPHIWLSPPKIKVQVKTIAAALKKLAPQHADDFDANLAAYLKKLDAVDLKVSEKVEPLLGDTFFVYHPAFGHFADEYGLYQEPLETGGKSPTQKALAEFIKTAKDANAKIIFVQPQFDERQAKTVAEAIGGKVVPLDPLEEDVLENLEVIADSIASALSPAQ